MVMSENKSVDKEQKINWEKLRQGFRSIPEGERARFEQAALQMRARLIKIPYYAERDSLYGMRYWRTLLACEYPVS